MRSLIFMDTQQSKNTLWGRMLFFLEASYRTYCRTPKLTTLVCIGFVNFALVGGQLAAYADRFIIAISTFLIMIILQTTYHIKISYQLACKHKMLLEYGIRDSFYLNSWCVVSVVFWVLNVSVGHSVALMISLALMGAWALVLKIIYTLVVAPKKKADYTISPLLPSDDLSEIHSNESFAKFRYGKETRNAISIQSGQRCAFKLNNPEANFIQFALALDPNLSLKSGMYKVNIKHANSNQIVFERQYDISRDYIVRDWIEYKVELPVDLMIERNDELIISVESSQSNQPIYFSEPRVNLNHKETKKIILVVLDGLRPDHLGCYGNGHESGITPYIDQLAKDSSLYCNAYAQANWTLPSFMSMLTGHYPSTHGVYHPREVVSLSKQIKTLPEILKSNGFFTRAYFTHKRLVTNYGFARGFDVHYHHQSNKEFGLGGADEITMKAIDALTYHADNNLFLMTHYFDAHEPYHMQSPYADQSVQQSELRGLINAKEFKRRYLGSNLELAALEQLKRNYDSEINRMDSRFGILMDRLKAMRMYDESLIIVLADHGTRFTNPNGLTQYSLFDESIKVPLIIKHPKSQEKHEFIKTYTLTSANLELMPIVLNSIWGSSSNIAQKYRVQPDLPDKGIVKSEMLYNNRYSISIRDQKYRYVAEFKFDMLNNVIDGSKIMKNDLFRVVDGRDSVVNVAPDHKQDVDYYAEIALQHVKDYK